MEHNIRQCDPELLQLLNNATNGYVTEDNTIFIVASSFGLILDKEKLHFSSDTHLVPTWKRIQQI